MTRVVHIVQTLGVYSNAQSEARITLPAAPFTIPTDDRRATLPRTPPIRYEGADFNPLKHDPIIKHASTRKDRG